MENGGIDNDSQLSLRQYLKNKENEDITPS
jgi:hypothetical protein